MQLKLETNTKKNRGINLILSGESTDCNEIESSRSINDHVRVIIVDFYTVGEKKPGKA